MCILFFVGPSSFFNPLYVVVLYRVTNMLTFFMTFSLILFSSTPSPKCPASIPEIKSQILRIRLFNHFPSTVFPGIFDMPIVNDGVYDGKYIIYSCEKFFLANEDNETANPPFFASLPVGFLGSSTLVYPSPLTVVSSSHPQHPNGPQKLRRTPEQSFNYGTYDASIYNGWAPNFPTFLLFRIQP